MVNGFGAGFFALSILAALAGLAVLLGVVGGIAIAYRRQSDRVADSIRYIAVALLGVVIAVAGVGVLAMADESAVVVGLLVALVFVPIAVSVSRLQRQRVAGWLDHLAIAGVAWSGPFVVGALAFFGVVIGGPRVWNLAPAESRSLGVAWLGVLAAGLVTTTGTIVLGRWLADRLSTPPPPGSG